MMKQLCLCVRTETVLLARIWRPTCASLSGPWSPSHQGPLRVPALQGGPGTGKTTLLRDVASLLSDTWKSLLPAWVSFRAALWNRLGLAS